MKLLRGICRAGLIREKKQCFGLNEVPGEVLCLIDVLIELVHNVNFERYPNSAL